MEAVRQRHDSSFGQIDHLVVWVIVDPLVMVLAVRVAGGS